MTSRESAVGSITDGVKVAVGILMTVKISPLVSHAISVSWLADLIGLIISVALVGLFSTKVFGWPKLEAVWYRENGLRRVSGSVLTYEKRQQVKKVEVHVKLVTSSVLARFYFRRFLGSIPVIRISAGQDQLLMGTVEEARAMYRADSNEGELEFRLIKSDKDTYEGWISFSWQIQGVRPQASTSRTVRVRLGDLSKGRVWPVDAASNIRIVELAA